MLAHAIRIFKKTEWLKKQLSQIAGVKISQSGHTFNEFVVELPIDADTAFAEMLKKGFACGYPLGRYFETLSHSLLIAVTEKRTRQEMVDFVEALQSVIMHNQPVASCQI